LRPWRELLLVALLVLGCARKDAKTTSAPDAPGPDAEAEASAKTSLEAGPAEAGADALPWPEAIRAERWADAEAAIARLPDEEQNAPEVRFARARALARLGKHRDAVLTLDGLEEALPLLRDLITRDRAEAALHAGPYDMAAEWFAARGSPAGWLSACEAWKKAGDTARARAACGRVVSFAKHTRAEEEAARAMRLELGREAAPAVAADDARWLAIHALDDATVRAARAVLDAQKPLKPLTAEELLARSRVLADAMRSDDALRAVERATSAPGRISPLEACHARAEAYYKARTRYAEAALVYRKCAKLGGARAAEDLFLVARAFSRADRDADALAAFQAVIQRHPRTPWAEQASFHVARTHALAGHWKDGAQALDAFVKAYPKSRERVEAERYRAISHLMAGHHKQARKLLEALADGEKQAIAQARWTNLAALAALRDGERMHAVARWSDVARSRPLTWPALVARARLKAAEAPLPPAIDPPDGLEAPAPLQAELPPPVDVLHRIGLETDAEEMLRGRETLVIGKSGGRGTEALCAAYGMLDRGRWRYRTSYRIPATLFDKAPGPGNRWAWECAFPRPYAAHVRGNAQKTSVSQDFVWAVMRVESAFSPEVVSPARAVGLLQLLPETARAVARSASISHEDADLTNAAKNITLGTLYLREQLATFGGSLPLAAGAYNAGPEAIERWKNRIKDTSIDVFVEMIPFLETRGYVVKVMSNTARYGYLDRGEAGVPEIALDLPAAPKR
jgi:soluble lytic murein transglycosylase